MSLRTCSCDLPQKLQRYGTFGDRAAGNWIPPGGSLGSDVLRARSLARRRGRFLLGGRVGRLSLAVTPTPLAVLQPRHDRRRLGGLVVRRSDQRLVAHGEDVVDPA